MRITPMPANWSPKVVELRDPDGKLIQKTVQHTEDGPIEILFPMPRLTAEAVAKTHPWRGLTDDEVLNALKCLDSQTARLPQGFKLFAQSIEAMLKEKNT
jgi:hypothetical protein